MDPSIREQATPEPVVRAKRDVYAVRTLVTEVTDLFPEVSYETSNPGPFGGNVTVSFDQSDTPDLFPLLALIESDERVQSVGETGDGDALVNFHANLRTQDSREPFGLAEAHAILTGESEAQWAENDARLEGDEG
jgi:hypothetical protein